MEITKYLCEFFFTDFWHWLGLVVILGIVFRFGLISFITDNSKNIIGKDKKDKEG